ncbi:HdeD family acid-resistance protein [Fructobacillus parabroussonetiae]|uniref:Integral membrane protein n=1 Tax=Fructobacillus parabroussonetiae TaxID=2713174 RepID=A0ABS5QVM5_9LACO|nr:DUF308 domain-containing protein [Fructobacillus parabroussonetiae]MBS9337249.1 hypothetical protein [Fructobacillus parabroussonetiae]MCK8617088.1 DUF308 domain-containing protein [Fructobacillus parabroussonetiae]
MQENRNERNWWTMAVGALFVIMALLMVNQPLASLVSLSYLFGLLALIHAFIVGYEAWTDRQLAQASSGWWLATFILDLVIAVLFLFHWVAGVSVIGVFFAIWFIWDAIFEIYMARLVRPLTKAQSFWTVVLGLISLLFGLILLFSPILAATVMVLLIAFYLFAFGVLLIARAW